MQSLLRAAGIFAILAATAQPAAARDQIRIVGSSTVYPFITAAAEQFGDDGKFHTPFVESTGTGGGFKIFCEGNGIDTPDINDASRKITGSESDLCHKNGVDYIEVTLGYDGIVIAGNKDALLLPLSKKALFLALARDLPGKDGKLVPNPNQTWHDADPALPAWPIELYGPPPTEGTRDAFVEMVMDKGCEESGLFPDAEQRKTACRLIREDGKYIESGGNYNLVVQKLTVNEHALGIIGYGYYEENTSRVHASPVDGVTPAVDTIESGKYGISRRLYIYIKKHHIGIVAGLPQFAREATGEDAIGPDGYMTAKGLLPLNEKDRKAMRELAESLGK